ncbi:MAG: DUF262 domain-containing protein [Candidatus Buchananbacteria bacterium]|nr:DUF262 domain-containing protein [Candidatus Buchananbacteria bacterium]
MKLKTLVSKEIKSLMGDQNSFYYIPDYQRPYSWETDNITDFWEDISKAYDNKDENYFLGSFILIENDDHKGFEVVDGQQRLTTITLFLAVLRDMFADNNRMDLAEKIQNEFIKKENRFRLYARSEDKLAFENNILNDINSLANYNGSKIRKQFKNTIAVFHNLIAMRSSEMNVSTEKFMDYLASIYEYLMSNVFVIIVVTEDIASAYTIFETINQRGKELRTEDLLKNFLLKKLLDEINKHNNESPNSQKNFDKEKLSLLSVWQRIEDTNIGMESLLNYHRTAILGTNPKKDLFKEITNYIRDKNITPYEFMSDWDKTVDAYLSLYQGDFYNQLNDKTKKILSLLWEINHNHWIPVLISARRANLPKEDFQELVFVLERMYALFWIAGYNAVKIKYPSWYIIRELISKNKSLDDIKDYIEKILVQNRVYNRFYESLEHDCYGNSWCKYILAKYEYSLVDDSVIKKVKFDSTVQIEHILPQTMSAKYWKENFTEDEHDKLVSTLGNLTLLIGGIKEKKKSKNQSAANKPFDEKIKVYMGEALKDGFSAFQMTQDLSKYDDWTPSVIRKRGKAIINKLEQLWEVSRDNVSNQSEEDEDEDEVQSEGGRNSFSLEPGQYNNIVLKKKLIDTLNIESAVIPRLKVFLQILASENKVFNREEIKEKLHQHGIGDNIGKTGRYLSNISQFLTKRNNSHLRQVVNFQTGGEMGELKNNYSLNEKYRELVKEVL